LLKKSPKKLHSKYKAEQVFISAIDKVKTEMKRQAIQFLEKPMISDINKIQNANMDDKNDRSFDLSTKSEFTIKDESNDAFEVD
jgi:hypothetical protein